MKIVLLFTKELTKLGPGFVNLIKGLVKFFVSISRLLNHLIENRAKHSFSSKHGNMTAFGKRKLQD